MIGQSQYVSAHVHDSWANATPGPLATLHCTQADPNRSKEIKKALPQRKFSRERFVRAFLMPRSGSLMSSDAFLVVPRTHTLTHPSLGSEFHAQSRSSVKNQSGRRKTCRGTRRGSGRVCGGCENNGDWYGKRIYQVVTYPACKPCMVRDPASSPRSSELEYPFPLGSSRKRRDTWSRFSRGIQYDRRSGQRSP